MEQKLDLRIQKTYLALHRAFIALLEEKRFEEVTVNELCERAMIRRATFYKHFADKYEYYAFYLKEISEEFRSRLTLDEDTKDCAAFFSNMALLLLHFMQEHQKLAENVLSSSMFGVLVTAVMEQIHGDAIRALRQTISCRTMSQTQLDGYAAFWAGGLLTTVSHYILHGSPVDEDEFLSVVSGFLPDSH